MRILLLAPHPFYQERGTPIAVDLLVRALAERGETVDLLTYHEGQDVAYGPNVTLHRIRPPPLARGIRPGFSLKKLIADARMYPAALRMARRNRYDVVHAVEEAVFMAQAIRRRLGVPYLYDMDSSMPRQIAAKAPWMRILMPFMLRRERNAIRKALVVVPMCDALADAARASGAARVTVLRDVSLLPAQAAAEESDLRQRFGIRGTCFLYVGNLERYQGIGLLLRSLALLLSRAVDAHLVVAGGAPRDVTHYSHFAEALGILARTHFLGPQPVERMGSLFRAADVLVSPRTQGENTPMKIYSYLDSGKAVLATRIPSHTQVLNDEVAVLADPEPDRLADAMQRLAESADLRRDLGDRARRLAQAKYSLPVFRRTVNELYDTVRDLLQNRAP